RGPGGGRGAPWSGDGGQACALLRDLLRGRVPESFSLGERLRDGLAANPRRRVDVTPHRKQLAYHSPRARRRGRAAAPKACAGRGLVRPGGAWAGAGPADGCITYKRNENNLQHVDRASPPHPTPAPPTT